MGEFRSELPIASGQQLHEIALAVVACLEVGDISGLRGTITQLGHARDQLDGFIVGAAVGKLLHVSGIDGERLAGMGSLARLGKGFLRSNRGARSLDRRPGFVERFFVGKNLDEKIARMIPAPMISSWRFPGGGLRFEEVDRALARRRSTKFDESFIWLKAWGILEDSP